MALWRLCASAAALLPAVALRSRRAEPGSVPPPEYEGWTAQEKVAWWKSNLDVGSGGSGNTAKWYESDATGCMKQECIYLGGRDTRKDIVPEYSCRQKGVHAEGMVAFVRAVWEDNPYTGMFQGADLGFARWGYQIMTEKFYNLSLYAEEYAAGNYKPKPGPASLDECDVKDCFNVTKPDRYSEFELEDGERPDTAMFMALKFFRDGVASAAMHTAAHGYPTGNFMSRFYSNFIQHLPEQTLNNTFPGSTSAQAAQRATRWPGFTGLHDMAMYDQEGNLQQKPNFPWQLVFFPTDATAGKIPENVVGFWPSILKKAQVLKPGTPIFDIYAKHDFASPLVKLGRIELASDFMLSADSDRQVFFYHPRYERDLILRPDLTEGLNCRTEWLCPICPTFPEYCSPDLLALSMWQELLEYGMAHPEWAYNGMQMYEKLGPLPKSAKDLAKRPTMCGGSAAVRHKMRSVAGKRLSEPGDAGMRDDDWKVEPLTGILREPNWFCSGENEWPTKNTRGLAESCNYTLVSGRMRQEPEYAAAPGCQAPPACTKADGTWYSTSYPCLCGTSTCTTGQLCMERTSTCTTWGPYALAAATEAR